MVIASTYDTSKAHVPVFTTHVHARQEECPALGEGHGAEDVMEQSSCATDRQTKGTQEWGGDSPLRPTWFFPLCLYCQPPPEIILLHCAIFHIGRLPRISMPEI